MSLSASALRAKAWLWLAAVIVIAGAAVAGPRLYRTALVGSGFTAEILCSAVFVSHRDEQAVLAEDLKGPGYELLSFFRERIERDRKRVTASFHGIASQTAIFRDGLGCTRIDGKSEEELRAEAADLFLLPQPAPESEALWPEGERVELDAPAQGVDGPALKAALDAAFTEPDSAHPRRTRALVVVHRGRIVAERYAPGFDAAMPLIGWSMTKAALSALVGLRVKDGKLAVTDKSLLPEWLRGGDPRREISLDDLLRMSSGLAFDETYDDPLADVAQMLFVAGDMARFAAAKKLVVFPGTEWHYSGGSSVIVARILRETFPTERDYLRYPRERLFQPLGMRSATLELDAAGTLRGVVVPVRLSARLGTSWPPVPSGWRVAGTAPLAGRLGRLQSRAGANLARRKLRRPSLAEIAGVRGTRRSADA
jgi:CubicO group peptidase (beta-lactamase class C family)